MVWILLGSFSLFIDTFEIHFELWWCLQITALLEENLKNPLEYIQEAAIASFHSFSLRFFSSPSENFDFAQTLTPR